jgi:hypothetical protein
MVEHNGRILHRRPLLYDDQHEPLESRRRRRRWRWPGWRRVWLPGLVGLILLVAVAIIVDDLVTAPDPALYDPTPAADPPAVSIDKDLKSIDTIADDLIKHGFGVDPLKDMTDEQLLAYEAAETQIERIPAYILAFKDRETTKSWAEAVDSFNGIAVIGDTWGISLDSEGNDREDQKSKALADKIAAEIGGKAQYR